VLALDDDAIQISYVTPEGWNKFEIQKKRPLKNSIYMLYFS
jgi:hypothetical protein